MSTFSNRSPRTSLSPNPKSSAADLPIGIFDSGLGGLTVARQIHRVLPREDMVYLGDTARVPYGTKSPSTVIRFACEDTRFLLDQNVKAVVVACNTASAWALGTLKTKFDVPVFGVIEPGVDAALRKTRNGRIGVIGTPATIRSQAYVRGIQERAPDTEVFGRACPLLVPLVEEGWLKHAVTREVLKEYLHPLLAKKVDTLVLGCTHYPLLKPAIRSVVNAPVYLVDSAQTCARYVAERLEKLGLLNASRRRPGKIHPYVTDDVERFATMSRLFLEVSTERPVLVELPA